MMYAVLSKKTGVIRVITASVDECMATKDFLESTGDTCVLVEVPQMLLDEFGSKLLKFQEEVTHDETV